MTAAEHSLIREFMGREPNQTESMIFALMWAESFSYRSSKSHLERLPTEGECLVQGPGENAGIVEISNGWCAAFKIDSNNHPALTGTGEEVGSGIGGVLRDIFTTGARPVATMNSLHFGSICQAGADPELEPGSDHETDLQCRVTSSVVKSLGDYGNAIGVPTIGGETCFDSKYSHNPIVNTFALGLVRREQIYDGKAVGVGNSVIYVGARADRHRTGWRADLAPQTSQGGQDTHPPSNGFAAEVDPFTDKLLLEASLEAMRWKAILGIEDMVGAGMASAACRIGARAGAGIEINLDLVPLDEAGSSEPDLMLTGAQDHLLLVAEKGCEKQVLEIFARWDLEATIIGRVITKRNLRVFRHGLLVADIPVAALLDDAPRHERPMTPCPVDEENVRPRIVSALETLAEVNGTAGSPSPARVNGRLLRRLLGSPNIGSKEWVYRQFDHTVRTNTVVLPGSDAAVIRVKETRHSLAMSVDGNGRYCRLNPREGARLAVVESARNVVCSGARPLAITNCLNFASPEDPQVMWAFSETIDGMAEVCRRLGTPVTGGHVSFHNETDGQGIGSTPVIGMLGLVEEARHITTQWFKNIGDVILLFGLTREDLGGSELLHGLTGDVRGKVPQLDLELEMAVQDGVLMAIRQGLVRSAHDCSEGGLAIAIAESCFSSYRRQALGARIDLTDHASESRISDPLTLLFAESPSRILVSVKPEDVEAVLSIAGEAKAPCRAIGKVTEDRLEIANVTTLLDESVGELEEIWRHSLSKSLDRQ